MGTVFGTLLGDLLVPSIPATRPQVVLMFVAAGLLGMLAMPFAWIATRREKLKGEDDDNGSLHPSSPTPHPSLLSLLRRYNPGLVLLVGVALGMGMVLPRTFLRTYAAELGISRIGLFFLVYSISAVLTRVLARRWPERFGPRRIILAGVAGLVLGVLLFMVVQTEWQLIVPALVFGCSHAILFPSIVAVGSATFPKRHRGLATVLVLTTWDLGLLVGAPTAGAVLQYSGSAGLPPYPTMFLVMAALLAAIGLCYAISSRRVAM